MSTTPIYVFARWQVKAGRLENVLQLLHQVARQSREEKGNLFYNVHQSISDPNTIVLSEAYTSQAALDDHRNAAHFQALVIGKIVPDLENREVILTSPIDL